MALMVEVCKQSGRDDVLFVRAEWEDGKLLWEREIIPVQDNMTAAETVEYFMLDKMNTVASWMWASGTARGQKILLGQFVHAAADGKKSYKEVSDSQAHLFDL